VAEAGESQAHEATPEQILESVQRSMKRNFLCTLFYFDTGIKPNMQWLWTYSLPSLRFFWLTSSDSDCLNCDWITTQDWMANIEIPNCWMLLATPNRHQSADYARLFTSARPFMLFCVGILIFGTGFWVKIYNWDGVTFPLVFDMFEGTDTLIMIWVVWTLGCNLSVEEIGFDPTVRVLTDLETQKLTGNTIRCCIILWQWPALVLHYRASNLGIDISFTFGLWHQRLWEECVFGRTKTHLDATPLCKKYD